MDWIHLLLHQKETYKTLFLRQSETPKLHYILAKNALPPGPLKTEENKEP